MSKTKAELIEEKKTLLTTLEQRDEVLTELRSFVRQQRRESQLRASLAVDVLSVILKVGKP